MFPLLIPTLITPQHG